MFASDTTATVTHLVKVATDTLVHRIDISGSHTELLCLRTYSSGGFRFLAAGGGNGCGLSPKLGGVRYCGREDSCILHFCNFSHVIASHYISVE